MSIIKVATKEDIAALELNKASNTSVQELASTVRALGTEKASVASLEELAGNVQELAENNLTGIVAITNGGTGATTAEQALINLGAAPASHTHDGLSAAYMSNYINFTNSGYLPESESASMLAYGQVFDIDFGITNSTHAKLWSNKIDGAIAADGGMMLSELKPAFMADFYFDKVEETTDIVGFAFEYGRECFIPFVVFQSQESSTKRKQLFRYDNDLNSFAGTAFIQPPANSGTAYAGLFWLRQEEGHLKLRFTCQSSVSCTAVMNLYGCVVND